MLSVDAPVSDAEQDAASDEAEADLHNLEDVSQFADTSDPVAALVQSSPPVHAASPEDPWASVRKHPRKPYNGAAMAENGGRTAATRKKRSDFLALVRGGSSIAQAIRDMGISPKTYDQWRKTDKIFKANIDVARTHNGAKRDMGWTGDSASFSETFFPKEFPTPGFHFEIKRRLKDAAPRTITLINVFPDSGKTAVIEDHICETLAVDPNHRFVIASKAMGHARKILGTIQDRMTNVAAYPEYIGKFGPFYVDGQERSGKPWTRDYIKVAQCDSGQRDHSVQVMGWDGTILGSRVDTIILDDIQTGDNLNLVDAMLRKFRQDFFTRLKTGRIIIIGNRIAVGDIYERLLELDIIEPQNHIDLPALDHEGTSLWPDRWSEEEFRVTRKVVGENIWWTMYMQKPQFASNATFTEDLLEEAKNWSRKVGSFVPGDPTLLSVDPGLDPGATAIWALQYGTEDIRVVDCEKHGDFVQQEQIIDLIEAYAIRYRPQHVVIETVAYQRALEKDERLQALARKYGFQTHKHETHRNKADPVMGVAAMASSFIRGEISFPYEGGPGGISATRMDPAIAEFAAWRPNIPTRLLTQDFPMAFWFGWRFIIEARHGMGIKADGWNRGGIPSAWTHKGNAWRVA